MRFLSIILFLSLPLTGLGDDTDGGPESLAQLEAKAKQNDPEAAFKLGQAYLTGTGVEKSTPQAAEWFQIAADLDHAPSHFRLGEIYLKGTPDIEANESRGLFHLQSAAETGLPEASALLGDLSVSKANNTDAKPDREAHFKEARQHYEQAILKNHPPSQLSLAYLLEQGQGGEADLPRAISLMEKSALSGHAQAMNELGLRFQQGAGVTRDPVTALGWFFAGAERSNPAAMTNLATCYARGIVLPVDPNKAGSWYSKAAKLNYAPAQFFLGDIFEKGTGVPANPVYAFVNYSRAAKNQHAKAQTALEALTLKLTPSQKEEALKLLNETP